MAQEGLSLHVPTYEELCYRQKWLQDPATMAYNKGYDLAFAGYDRATGCIAFPKEAWADWYAYFVGQQPQRFYAYILRDADGAFLGEVNLHKPDGDDWYEMGIVLDAAYRGQGYATAALRLLLRQAFEKMGAEGVRNTFEPTRRAAVQTHLSAGFAVYRQTADLLEVRITKEQYAQQQSAAPELWDAYDADGHKLPDLRLVRGQSLPDGVFHLVCEVVVRHADGSYLLMQRAATKPGGGLWELTAGGSALQGEDAAACAARELREETGLVADSLREIRQMAYPQRHTRYATYLCLTACPKDAVTLQPGETAAFRWVERQTLLALPDDAFFSDRTRQLVEQLGL